MKPRDDGERDSNYSEFLHENLTCVWRLTVPRYFRQWLVACPTPNIYREICFHFAYCVVKGKHSWNSHNNGVTSFYRNILMKIWSVIPAILWWNYFVKGIRGELWLINIHLLQFFDKPSLYYAFRNKQARICFNQNGGVYKPYIELIQERRNFSTLAMEICFPCTEPSIYYIYISHIGRL